jgi:hypothetical protein
MPWLLFPSKTDIEIDSLNMNCQKRKAQEEPLRGMYPQHWS